MGIDMIGLIVGMVVTLAIFSFLLGDNVLYRWMLALLVGSGVGYVMGVVLKVVLIDWFLAARGANTLSAQIYYFVPVFLGVLLLFKGFSSIKPLARLSVLGNIPMGYLIGAGAGVAIGGALLGTLFPQIGATGAALKMDSLWGLLQGIVMVVGVIAALLVFSSRPIGKDGETKPAVLARRLWMRRFGEFFIIIALAAAFAGAITTGLTQWVERWSTLLRTALDLIGIGG
jgi:hypothetical protein